MDYTKYYDLESYLFGEVTQRFRRTRRLDAFDFFCIVVWKANRAKSKMAARLLGHGYSALEPAVGALTEAIAKAPDGCRRLEILIDQWGFRLPMASAILSVLYPDAFTVYDVRVCELLGDFEDAQYKQFPSLWERYCAYVARVNAEIPEKKSLREKDRALWGKSFRMQLERNIRDGFGKASERRSVGTRGAGRNRTGE